MESNRKDRVQNAMEDLHFCIGCPTASSDRCLPTPQGVEPDRLASTCRNALTKDSTLHGLGICPDYDMWPVVR